MQNDLMPAGQSFGSRVPAVGLEWDDGKSKGLTDCGKTSDHILPVTKIVDDQGDFSLMRRISLRSDTRRHRLFGRRHNIQAVADYGQRTAA